MENILMLAKETNNFRPLRLTSQRKAIIKLLYSNQHKHLTAADIHHTLWRQGKKLGRSTIYRNLVTLEKLGLISKLSRESKGYSYKLTSKSSYSHYEFVCLNCGEVIAMEDPMCYRSIYLNALDCNFQIAQIDLTIKGYCKNCQGSIKKGGKSNEEWLSKNNS